MLGELQVFTVQLNARALRIATLEQQIADLQDELQMIYNLQDQTACAVLSLDEVERLETENFVLRAQQYGLEQVVYAALEWITNPRVRTWLKLCRRIKTVYPTVKPASAAGLLQVANELLARPKMVAAKEI